jgi:hypothetical protein
MELNRPNRSAAAFLALGLILSLFVTGCASPRAPRPTRR